VILFAIALLLGLVLGTGVVAVTSYRGGRRDRWAVERGKHAARGKILRAI
jgi:hypothetical protein